jgi:CheY-like chemotaxis protein
MKNILIIDDNKDLLDALSAALCCHLKECAIMTALDGAKGVKIIESAPIDLIVTDLAMPVMNGYLFIEYAKKHYPAIPICVMTGSCSPQILERLRSLGVGRWIEKPFQLDDLLHVISKELYLETQSTGCKSIGTLQ